VARSPREPVTPQPPKGPQTAKRSLTESRFGP
jgi:hypothetical protein